MVKKVSLPPHERHPLSALRWLIQRLFGRFRAWAEPRAETLRAPKMPTNAPTLVLELAV